MNRKGNHIFFSKNLWGFIENDTLFQIHQFWFPGVCQERLLPSKGEVPFCFVIVTSKLSYGKFSTSLPHLMVQGERNRVPILIFHPSELFLLIWRGTENGKIKITRMPCNSSEVYYHKQVMVWSLGKYQQAKEGCSKQKFVGQVSVDEFTGPRTPTVINCGHVLPSLGLTDQEPPGSPGSSNAREITAERGRHVEGK